TAPGSGCVVRTLVEQLPYGDAVDPELLARAEVRQEEDADRVLTCAPARRADPALPAEAAHPRTCADRALLEVGCRTAHGPGDVGGLHVGHARVGEPAVVAFADHGDDHLLDAYPRIRGHRHRDSAVVDAPDGVRGGEIDRSFEQSPFADLERAGEFTSAVEERGAGRQR